MSFYKKIGRLTKDEQAVVNQIKKLAEQKGISTHELEDCYSLDDLLNLLHSISEDTQRVADFVEEKDNKEIGEQTSFKDEFNPLESEFQRQSEAFTATDGGQESAEDQITFGNKVASTSEMVEDTADKSEDETYDKEREFEDYDPFSDEIIERSYNGQSDENGEKQSAPNTPNNTSNIEAMGDEPPLKESHGTPVDNLNPNTKRKAAEQTASALLKGYAKIAPKPFKWLAKIDEEKIEKLSFEGQIDISIEVSEGMTFDDYMKQTNAQVDEIFEVEQDTLDEIREPLVEVLMEQQLELTPQQRLGLAVFSHLIQMLTVALKLRKQNNRILAYQKKITRMGHFAAA